MNFTHHAADRRWNVDEQPRPKLDDVTIRHLGEAEGWAPGMAPVALVRGTGHGSHVTINGWPFCYIGTVTEGPDAGNTLYRSY